MSSETANQKPLKQIGWVVLLLAFTSGFIIMSVELLGGRILAPYFGSSIYVWGSIISIFMVALSVGYLIGGRLSVNRPNLRRYGLFVVLAALGQLPIVFVANQAMEAVFMAIDDPRYGSLLASTLLFFIPTAILGMIAPYSVRLMVDNTERSGQVAGGLYFISTLGSALGTLLTSFYIVLWFDMNTILLAMVSILLLAGVLAFTLGSKRS